MPPECYTSSDIIYFKVLYEEPYLLQLRLSRTEATSTHGMALEASSPNETPVYTFSSRRQASQTSRKEERKAKRTEVTAIKKSRNESVIENVLLL